LGFDFRFMIGSGTRFQVGVRFVNARRQRERFATDARDFEDRPRRPSRNVNRPL